MNRRIDVADERIRAVFERRAGRSGPDALLTSILAVTASTPQDRRWAIDFRDRFGQPTAPRIMVLIAVSGALIGAMLGVAGGGSPLPTNRSTTPFGTEVGPVSQAWTTDSSVALTITRSAGDDGDYYWRVLAYDRADLTGWSSGDTMTISKPAGSNIFEGLADSPGGPGLHTFAFTVRPVGFTEPLIVSPRTPVLVDEAVRLSYVGEAGYFTRMEREGGAGEYQITALVPIPGNENGQLNSAALRATSTEYPAEILARFAAQPPPGSLGPEAQKLEAKIIAEAGSRRPIDIANQLVEELRSDTYEYVTDVRDLPCQTLSTVECFATYKQGYCQYYARTMATILRNQGIPTRIVEGFLPGSRQAGIETILDSSAHEWVEVYFMDFGWVVFDPTGGDLAGQVGPLPSGIPVASPSTRTGGRATD